MEGCCILAMNLTYLYRAKFKYKFIAIVMGLLMIYMGIASVVCAAQVGQQGGTANSVMLFSILITFGCQCSIYFNKPKKETGLLFASL